MGELTEDQLFETDSYGNMTSGKISERIFHKLRLKQILTATSFDNKKVLESGCGSGVVVIPLASRGIEIYGIDKSEYAIKKCREYCDAKGLKVKLKVADAKQIPFKDREFDIVILADVLEHVTSPEIAVKEAERVCKNKGTIIVTLPSMIHKSMLLKKILSSRDDLDSKPEHPIEFEKVIKMFKKSKLKKVNKFALFSEIRLIFQKGIVD